MKLIAQAAAQGVALILRVGKVAGELVFGLGRVVAEEEAAGDGDPHIADLVGVADGAGEAMPARESRACLPRRR